MESFCLASLIRNTRLLYQVNRVIGECLEREEMCRVQPGLRDMAWPNLSTIQPFIIASDFVHPEYRAIFEAWQAALVQDDVEPVQYLAQVLDPALYRLVDEWRSKPLDQLSRGIIPPRKKVTDDNDDIFVTEAIHRLLGLRHSRIDEYIKELTYIMQDNEHQGSLTAKEYASTINVLLAARHRLSQARQSSSFTRRPNQPSDVKQYRAS
jgi:hypothetical protein